MSAAYEQSLSKAMPEQRHSDLLQAAQFYRAILELSVDGILTLDSAGRIESFNDSARRLFGYGPASVSGQCFSMLVAPPFQERCLHTIIGCSSVSTADASTVEGSHGTHESLGLRRDGSTFPMEVAVAAVNFPDRCLLAVIVRDLSAQRLSDESARAAHTAAMDEHTHTHADEVIEPLTAIICHAESCLRLLRRGAVAPEILADSLQRMVAQGMRAADLVRRSRDHTEALPQQPPRTQGTAG